MNNAANILTESRTLYDKEGRAVVSVGPYNPAVAGKDRVGTETVYDLLGRVERIRKWADVEIVFATEVAKNSEIIVKLPDGLRAGNAWDGTGTAPTDLAWTSSGKLPVTIAAPAAGQTGPLSWSRTEYDTAGRVWKSYSLNELGTEICTNQYVYDLAGRQKKTIALPNDTAGKRCETTTLYDGSRRQSVTDGLNHKTEFEYDDLGRVICTIHPATIVSPGTVPVTTYTHVGYDGMGRKDAESSQTVHAGTTADPVPDLEIKFYNYDVAGRLISVKMPAVPNPENSSTMTNPIYNYYYDNNGDQVCILDAKGQATVFEYDHLHRLTKKYQPYPTTFTPSLPPANRPALGDILSQKPANHPFEYKQYDSTYGRLTLELDFKQQATGYFYDALGRLEDTKYYAADGTPGVYGNDNYPSNPAEAVRYTYDNLVRKETETVTDYTGTPTVIYQAGYQYDNEGRLDSILVSQGGGQYILDYVYNPITGQKIDTKVWKSDGTGGWIEDTSTDYGYDELGRLKTVTADIRNGADVNEQTAYEYDLVGNRKSTTLPNGVYTEYSYNALNRLTALVHYQTTAKLSAVGSFSYKLNSQGMRTGVTEQLDETRYLEYQYDGLNRLEYEYSDNKAGSNIDNPTPPSDIRGYKSKYVYDLVGNRLSRTVNVRNDSGQQDLATTYDYYPGTDKLYHEYHSGPEIVFQWGGSPVYVYASADGGWSYQLRDMTHRVGTFCVFAMGMPTGWDRWLLITLMILLPVVYFWPVFKRWYCVGWTTPTRKNDPLQAPDLKLWHRCLCLLFSYVFLIGPECFQMLAYADTQYSQLSTASWGSGNRTIEYQYDTNGSMISKTTKKTLSNETVETVVYVYNLQNRLAKVTTTPYTGGVAGSATVVEYKYNPDGICTEEKETTPTTAHRTDYLIDPANPTGYAQVLQETEYDISGANPVPLNRTDYVLGDDVISQTKSTWSGSTWSTGQTQYLLYDGQGSTRQLVNANLSVQESYSYDGYGVMLGSAAAPANSAQTNMLYCGEQYDKSLSQYYLRARYYNPANGLFNQMDPYAGNTQDPQSLHKYTYCHNNPVNANDPSGMMGDFTLVGSLMTMAIMTIMMSATTVNGPTLNGTTYADNSGQIILDTGIAMGLSTGCTLVARFIIQPLCAAASPYIRSLLDQLRFRNATPVPSIESPITNPRRLLTGPTQLEINQEMGATFEDAVRASLRTTKGTPVVTSYGAVKPDFPVGNMYGVTDAKNVVTLTRSPQLKGFEEIAKSQKLPFNLVISPRTQTVSEPLKKAIYGTGGNIFEYDIASGTFRTATFRGNQVIR